MTTALAIPAVFEQILAHVHPQDKRTLFSVVLTCRAACSAALEFLWAELPNFEPLGRLFSAAQSKEGYKKVNILRIASSYANGHSS